MHQKKRSDILLLKLIICSILFVIIIHWYFGLPKQPVTELGIEAMPLASTPSGNLRLMTWNIHYGKGALKDNDFYATEAETLSNLNSIVNLIKEHKIDVIAMQEIDFYASRSYYIDEVNYIAEKANFPYLARALGWDVKYVPFPYWPPKKHFGRVKSGIAVLSKYPIKKNIRYLFEKPKDNSWYYNLFYLDRLTQEVVITINGKEITLFNTHLEAFKSDTREDQAKLLSSIILNSTPSNLILLGDLNAVPSEATKKENFPDEPEIHYSDKTIAILKEKTSLKPVISSAEYIADEQLYFTHPSYDPNRKLDHIFISDSFNLFDTKTIFEAGNISDHLPVYAELEVK